MHHVIYEVGFFALPLVRQDGQVNIQGRHRRPVVNVQLVLAVSDKPPVEPVGHPEELVVIPGEGVAAGDGAGNVLESLRHPVIPVHLFG